MKKFLVAATMSLLPLTLASSPAFADHGYGGGNRGGDQGNGNEREEEYGEGSCKYFCPAFDRSPVQDSFNPTICVMPGSCTSDGKQRDEPQR